MADAFLGVLLNNLNSLIHEELGLLWGVKDEMEKLSSMLSTIQAVVADAEERQYKDEAIKNWLRKLNTVALEVDDILDDCATEASKSKQPDLKLIKKSGISRICGCFSQPPQPQLNLNIAFRRNIGKRMKEINERLDLIARERNNFHLSDKPANHSRDEAACFRETSSILTGSQVYGREEDKEKIVHILVHGVSECRDVSVLPVTGMGGLGKTTLAQMVFNDNRVIEHFDPRLWVCVSEDFDVKRLLKEIIESVEHGKSPNVSNLDALQRHLQELLNGKKYLLVLDDVWNEVHEKWEELKSVLACGSRGASIVTTTRNPMVAKIMGTMPAHCLSTLSEEDCFSLFKQRAFGGEVEECPSLVQIGKEIVRKCGGLPLAAKTLSGLLYFKKEEHEWISIRDNDIWNLPGDGNSILPSLRLSYHHLPTKLRTCFSYCAIFAKDKRISKRRVIRFWIAHGFISSDGRRVVEDAADGIWNELHIRSFFQDVRVSLNGDFTFKMHDLIHDLAQSIVVDKYQIGVSNTIIRHGRHYDRGMYNMTFPGLTILGTDISSEFKKFNSLRVLDASYCGLHDLPSTIGILKQLRYLDLAYCQLETLPDEIGCLSKLQNLNLLGCRKLLRLPNTVCNLYNLLVLNLMYCSQLRELPKLLSNLTQLRHLQFSPLHITQMPPDIGKLSSLRTLTGYIVGFTEGHKIQELGTLNDLSGELEITKLENVENTEDAKKANLAAKRNIRSLKLRWAWWSSPRPKIGMNDVLEALQVPPNLQRLELRGYGGTIFPSWMSAQVMQNVTHIHMSGCKHCKYLPPFGQLPSLRSLKLERIPMVEYIDDGDQVVHSTNGNGGGAAKFKFLEELWIQELPHLKGFFPSRVEQEERDQFPRLHKLFIRNCPGLTSLVGLSSLKNLRIWCSDNMSFLTEEMLQDLTHLESLNFRSLCNLQVLPSSLACLTALKRLEVKLCDELDSLPEDGLQGLTSLSHLEINNCKKFKSLSEGLGYLTSLETLRIGRCPELVSLPEGIKNLSCLRRLSLGGDPKITALPDAIRHVNSLQYLYIYDCPSLASLPDWLEDLSSLESLKIHDCPKVVSLPATLERMAILEYLSIYRCPELKRRCEKGSGDDWHKIAHIQQVNLW